MTPGVRIGIISDTHVPLRGRELPAQCRARLKAADLIIHAGDHCDLPSLHALRAIGPPVVTVHGNVDDAQVRAAAPRDVEIAVGDTRLAVIHDAGPRRGRLVRMRRQFPFAQIVVFGHSHIALIECDDDGFLIINPGSPTDRRQQPAHTMAELLLHAGRAPVVAIIELDSEARDSVPNL